MKINISFSNFKKKHKNKKNQVIFHKANCKNNKIIENIINNYLIKKNSFIFESVEKGTPRAESQAIRARLPHVFWSFQNTWQTVFVEGIVNHDLKELCRVYVSQSVECQYCGNQRSSKSTASGLAESKYKELLNFEKSDRYDGATKAALALTEAITWDLDTNDMFWTRLYQFFSEEEIIEIGYFVGFTMGQQRFNRLLNIHDHLGTTGFESMSKSEN